MKTLKFLRNIAIVALAFVALTACDEDQEKLKVNFSDKSNVSYNADNYWNEVYNPAVGAFTISSFTFSHEATATEWDGYTYYSWYGFCPSKSTDNADYGDGDWTSHQWGSITGDGASGKKDAYILGCWNTSEDINSLPAIPSCYLAYRGGSFDPEEVYITNSAWGYYAMKNGSAFNKKFGNNDWCTLHIYGVSNGKVSGLVEVALADGTDILKHWKRVNLEPLGDDVDMIYFQLSSSDTGVWGMNNPAFFCLDNLVIDID